MIFVNCHLVLTSPLVLQISDGPGSFARRVYDGELTTTERNAFNIKIGDNKYRFYHTMGQLRERITPKPLDALCYKLSLRLKVFELNIKYFELCKEFLTKELEEVDKFDENRPNYELRVKLFQDSQLFQRRQRAVQKEFEERKVSSHRSFHMSHICRHIMAL